MGLFSLEKIFGATIRESATDGSDFTNPDADYRRLFLGEDGLLHLKDSAGAVTDIGASGGVATDAIWDAAGDLAQGTGANTAAKLGAGTVGQFLMSGGAAAANAWGSRELDYVEYTSPVSVTATTEAAADTVVTANSITGDAVMKIMVECFVPYVSTPAANDSIRIVLYDNAGGAGAASIGMLALITNPHATVLMRPSALVQRRLTPTAATHVYSIRSFVGSGTGSIGAGAGGSGNIMPGFIRILRAV